jgi:enoyl-CoA hydratase/carnithine racemase
MQFGEDIEQVVASLDDFVLTLGINRPEKKNALLGSMYTRLADLINAAGKSRQVRVILLTGAKDCFSSGNDVSTFQGEDGEPIEPIADFPSVRFLNAIAACELPIVAAVNGPAVGVGTTMLLHCDFVIAGDDARFRTPFVQLGLCPEAGSSYTMPMRMGYSRAAQMLLLGETFSAQQAVDCGLATSMHAVDEFEQVAADIALRLSRQPPTSVRATKKLMRAPLMEVIPVAMQQENKAFGQCMETPEFTEAITAFMEGREADFSAC